MPVITPQQQYRFQKCKEQLEEIKQRLKGAHYSFYNSSIIMKLSVIFMIETRYDDDNDNSYLKMAMQGALCLHMLNKIYQKYNQPAPAHETQILPPESNSLYNYNEYLDRLENDALPALEKIADDQEKVSFRSALIIRPACFMLNAYLAYPDYPNIAYANHSAAKLLAINYFTGDRLKL